MRYRIRYQHGGRNETGEVEANSPHEAVVKFEQARDPTTRATSARLRVTSVSPAETGEDFT